MLVDVGESKTPISFVLTRSKVKVTIKGHICDQLCKTVSTYIKTYRYYPAHFFFSSSFPKPFLLGKSFNTYWALLNAINPPHELEF